MRSGREMTFTQKDTFDGLTGLSRTVCPRLSTPVRELVKNKSPDPKIPEIILISRKTTQDFSLYPVF